MARFGCRCGETLWNGLTPNDIQLYVFTDRQMDKILESNSMETLDFFELNNYEVWLCPECKRLAVFEKDSNSVKYIYKLESEVIENEHVYADDG